MRKILTFLICLTMGALLFVGCNSALPPDASDIGNGGSSSSWGEGDSSLGGDSSLSGDSSVSTGGGDENAEQGGSNSSEFTGNDTPTETPPKDEDENGGWLGKYY